MTNLWHPDNLKEGASYQFTYRNLENQFVTEIGVFQYMDIYNGDKERSLWLWFEVDDGIVASIPFAAKEILAVDDILC